MASNTQAPDKCWQFGRRTIAQIQRLSFPELMVEIQCVAKVYAEPLPTLRITLTG